jgi:hypothetical protein
MRNLMIDVRTNNKSKSFSECLKKFSCTFQFSSSFPFPFLSSESDSVATNQFSIVLSAVGSANTLWNSALENINRIFIHSSLNLFNILNSLPQKVALSSSHHITSSALSQENKGSFDVGFVTIGSNPPSLEPVQVKSTNFTQEKSDSNLGGF